MSWRKRLNSVGDRSEPTNQPYFRGERTVQRRLSQEGEANTIFDKIHYGNYERNRTKSAQKIV